MEPTLEDFRRAFQYDEKTGIITWKKRCGKSTISVGSVAGTVRPERGGHIEIKFMEKTYRAHRIAWFMTYGEWPKGILDHKNRNAADNRIENLRLATDQQSVFNRGVLKNNRLGIKGVSLFRTPTRILFHARIMKNKKSIHLGFFETLKEAEQARVNAERRLFGEFGRIELAQEMA